MDNKKYESLVEQLRKTIALGKGLCVAFSGGIDSCLLLYTASKLTDNTIAITFVHEFYPENELNSAREFTKTHNIRHEFIAFNPLSSNDIKNVYRDSIIKIRNNDINRCYYCKKTLFSMACDYAKQYNCALLDGTNADDITAYRPGLAALRELNILSPLADAGITKSEIREIASILKLKSAKKPSNPCLATRFPYGTQLTCELVSRIERGEAFLSEKKYENFRIRCHVEDYGDIARIELNPCDMERFLRDTEIVPYLKKLGFTYITLDTEGFRSGSMDINVRN